MQVTRVLLSSNFDLAFEVINAFGLRPLQMYGAAAKHMAENGDYRGIQQLLNDLKTTSAELEIERVHCPIRPFLHPSRFPFPSLSIWIL